MRLVFLTALSAAAAAPPPVAAGDLLALWDCADYSSGRQAFDYGNASNSALAVGVRGSGNLVLDIVGPSNDTGTGVHAWGLYTPLRPNQQWVFDGPDSQLRSAWGKCLGVVGAAPFAGAPLVLVDCAAGARFTFVNATGVFSTPDGAGGRLCVAAGSSASCAVPPFSGYAYCNVSLGPAVRAADLAARLAVPDWASLLQNANVGVPRLGIPSITYNEALHGVVYGCGPPHTDPATGYTSSGCATSFPHATLMGGAFNRSLWRAVATVISDEGRALHNTNGYALITWAPDINPCVTWDVRAGAGMAGACGRQNAAAHAAR